MSDKIGMGWLTPSTLSSSASGSISVGFIGNDKAPTIPDGTVGVGFLPEQEE